MSQTFHIRLFARFREIIGSDILEVELPGPTHVGQLRVAIAAQYPSIADLLNRSPLAVNNDYASNDRLVEATDEIALIPPVSGGSIRNLFHVSW